MSQNRRNLTIEFLDLSFASRRKLCRNSVFYKNMNTVAEDVGGGLATGWFITVANFVPHFFGGNSCRKVLDGKFSNVEIWFHVRANWEDFLFLQILSNIMHWWFSLWKGVLFQRSVKNYWMLFAECDRNSPIKNFIASRWYISQIYCRKYKEICVSQVKQVLNRCFFVFLVRIGKG